jgi:hypothetical protein
MIKRTYADFFRFLMNFISTFAQLLHRNFVYTCYVPHLKTVYITKRTTDTISP